MALGIGGWTYRGTHADTVEKSNGKRSLLCGWWESLGELAGSPGEGVGLGDLEGCLRDLIIWWIIGSH